MRFYDYSVETPAVSTHSPHQNMAWGAGSGFRSVVEEEIQKGWIGEAQLYSPAIPFQMTPGGMEPKKGGSWRIVWNAS